MEKLRTFVAIDLPRAVRDEASRLIDELAASHADVKWVRPDALHLTLKFMGSIVTEQVERVLEGVAEAARSRDPFEAEFAGLGAFPDLGRPRVVWVGTARGASDLELLARAVETALEGRGFPPEERPFLPHLTLGRVRGARGARRLTEQMEGARGRSLGTLRVEEVVTYRSELGPGGARYTSLGAAMLGRTAQGEGH